MSESCKPGQRYGVPEGMVVPGTKNVPALERKDPDCIVAQEKVAILKNHLGLRR